MENHIPRNKNLTSFGMKTFIAFMVRAITQEHMVWTEERICELYGLRLGKQAQPNTFRN